MKKSTSLTLLFVLIFLTGTLSFVAYINWTLNHSHSVENTNIPEEKYSTLLTDYTDPQSIVDSVSTSPY